MYTCVYRGVRHGGCVLLLKGCRALSRKVLCVLFFTIYLPFCYAVLLASRNRFLMSRQVVTIRALVAAGIIKSMGCPSS